MAPETRIERISRLSNELWEANRSSWIRGLKIKAALSNISNNGDPDHLLTVLPFTYDTKESIRLEAGHCIHHLMDCLTGKDPAQFDQSCRSSYYSGEYSPRPAKAWLSWLQAQPFQDQVLCVLSMSHSGYLRQMAVEEMKRSNADITLPFLLLRTNDWVKQVREESLRNMPVLLEKAAPASLLKCLPALLRFKNVLRERPDDLIRHMEQKMGQLCDLLSHEKGESPKIIRYRFYLAWNYGPLSKDKIIHLAFSASDPTLKSQFTELILRDQSLDKELFLPLLIQDKSAFVRIRIVGYLATTEPNRYREELISALLDKSKSVQRVARYYCKEKFNLDLAIIYRSSLVSVKTHVIASALNGLGEVGTAEDIALIRPYLQNSTPGVQASALCALVLLKSEDRGDLLQAAFESLQPALVKASAHLLGKEPALINISHMAELFKYSKTPTFSKRILEVSSHLSKWAHLHFVLEAISFENEEIRISGHLSLKSWLYLFNTSFIKPSDQDKERLRLSWPKACSKIKPIEKLQVESILKAYL